MKSLIITLLISLSALGTYAQCGDNVILVSTKTTLDDPNGGPQRTKDEKTVLKFSKGSIALNLDDQDRGELKIVSQTCNWTVPYKEGSTIIKASFNDSDYSLTIEGKDGKISLRVLKLGSDDSIMSMTADKYEKLN